MSTKKRGKGGEVRPVANDASEFMTNNNGVVVPDDQNSLKAGTRGPTLLEDLFLREKLTHFDHERIPERVVHARGFGVKGYFQCYDGNSDLTRAEFLTNPRTKTPVFCRFSTVVGSEGSSDCARDARGFAVKFYTSAGNYDLVSNNIPVFFIQDAMKFPDLVHSIKPEQDRGFPQASAAHNTFWDFISQMPESMHMIMWLMSDRAIPRSYRMMEGFGVNTFRMVNAEGKSKFIKFHWRPKLGTFSLIWPEAVVINGADPDYHRRDLWEAIESGDYPEYELCVQEFTEKQAEKFDFDILDATKIIPEERVPLRPLGKMILNENVSNFFSETEQVAFCPANLVPGIELSNDPLLQGRLFSYLDTQLSRLGSPNFTQIPVNAPKVPSRNLQRDGQMQMAVPSGPVAHSPQALSEDIPAESPEHGLRTFPAPVEGEKIRVRPESFADHYTQAKLFYISLTDYEQQHVANALVFELGKCSDSKVRERVLGHLAQVHDELYATVSEKLGHKADTRSIMISKPAGRVTPSDAVSQYKKAPQSIAGKKIAVLATEGYDGALLSKLTRTAKKEKAKVVVIGLKPGPLKDDAGSEIMPYDFLKGAPSALFDYVVVAPASNGELDSNEEAIEWVRMAYKHLKVIGYTDTAAGLLEAARVEPAMEGIHNLSGANFNPFIGDAKRHRIWNRPIE
jgi:catalase